MTIILNGLSDPNISELLNNGAIGVLPTDTVYGLACRASDKIAVRHLYKTKLREQKPGTIIAASLEQLVELGLKARYLKAVERFWPNAVTIIIPCTPELNYLDLGLGTLAVRIPNHKTLNTLMKKTGPLLTTSANLPGEPPANTIADARAYFADTVDFYVDGGDLASHQASTIIRIVDDAIEVLRHGQVIIDEETGRIQS